MSGANRTIPVPDDHDERLARALLSLDGLSVGDAFGQRFFYPPSVESLIAGRAVPAPQKYGCLRPAPRFCHS